METLTGGTKVMVKIRALMEDDNRMCLSPKNKYHNNNNTHLLSSSFFLSILIQTVLFDGKERIRYHLQQNNIDLLKVDKIAQLLLKYSIKKGYVPKKQKSNKSEQPKQTEQTELQYDPNPTFGVSPTAPLLPTPASTTTITDDHEEQIRLQENKAIATAAAISLTGIDHIALSGLLKVYDGDNDGALTVAEVHEWMTHARDAYGGDSGPPVLVDAAMLVHSFDEDGSLTLNEQEISKWLQEGVEHTHEERMKLAITSKEAEAQGASHPRVMEFMTNVLLSLDDR